MTNVGRILCLTTDGHPQFTVDYRMPTVLREAEVFTPHGVYRQNTITSTGRHVYKYERPLVGQPEVNLVEYRYPTDANWDGPQVARPLATWDHVRDRFETALRDDQTAGLQELFDLTYAAFHHLPIPGLSSETPVTVPVMTPPRSYRTDEKWLDFDGGIREQ